MKGTELTARLIENIETSIGLRSRIPYLDSLRELVEGGKMVTNEVVNTSSNFGSFDNYLNEVLAILHTVNNKFIQPSNSFPLHLSLISTNLKANKELLSNILQDVIAGKVNVVIPYTETSTLLLYRLELINSSAV